MVRKERGLYRRTDSPFWWLDVVLPGGHRVCQSTRLRDRDAANEFLIRLKADAYEIQRCGKPRERSWQEAVVRYLQESDNPNRVVACRDHLRQLDAFIGQLMLHEINLDTLQPFMRHRKEIDGVSNAAVARMGLTGVDEDERDAVLGVPLGHRLESWRRQPAIGSRDRTELDHARAAAPVAR